MGIVNQTIQYKGVELDIEFYFSPSEPEVKYYADGSGYPGCSEDIELYSIGHRGDDVTELLEDQIDKIVEQIFEERQNNG